MVAWGYESTAHWAGHQTGPGTAVPLCLQHAPHGIPGCNAALRRRLAAERSTGDSIQHSHDDRAHGRGESEATRRHPRHGPDDPDAEPQPPGTRWRDRARPASRRTIKAMRLTPKGRRALKAAWPLWA